MKYRINYGNGQVSRTHATYDSVRTELLLSRGDQYSEYFRVEKYAGDGEWVGLGKAGRLATSSREGL